MALCQKASTRKTLKEGSNIYPLADKAELIVQIKIV
jgi:hypothetical protein